MDFAFGFVSKSSLPSPRSITFSPMFSSKGIRVLRSTFGVMIYFELIFEQGARVGKNSAFCIGTPNYSNTIYWKNDHFPLNFFCTFSKLVDDIYEGLFLGYFVPSTFVSFLSPITHRLDYYSFKVGLGMSYWKSSNFILLWLFKFTFLNLF